jgi:hypothetical protein
MVIGKEMGQLPVADRRQIVGSRERSPEVALGHQPPLSDICRTNPSCRDDRARNAAQAAQI